MNPVCEMLEMLLTGRGHRVTLCASGEEALVELSKETYELVLTDIKMPGMNGVELFEAHSRKMVFHSR